MFQALADKNEVQRIEKHTFLCDPEKEVSNTTHIPHERFGLGNCVVSSPTTELLTYPIYVYQYI